MDHFRERKLPVWAGFAVAGVLFLILLPLTLPVVLGIVAAAVLEPLVVRLQRFAGLSRRWASFITVTGALLLFGGGFFWLGRLLLRELLGLGDALPAILESMSAAGQRLTGLLDEFSAGLPAGAGEALRAWGQGIVSGSGSLPQALYNRALSLVSRILSALPKSLFFLLTTILSCYFAAGELSRLRELAILRLPPEVTRRTGTVLRSLKTTLGGWLRAQLGLMGVTFAVLLPGLLLLRVSSPLIASLGIALLDALPLLGTGALLIPWAAAAMLQGRTGLGLGLLGLYGVTALLRNILEPRFLGAQLGVSPLLTLAALYAGWRLGGVLGMVLLPAGALAAAQLWAASRHPPAGHGDPLSFQSAVYGKNRGK